MLDYESIVYNTAAEKSAKNLDCIQNQALRLCTGVTKSTPTASLQVEMGEIPLDIRREKLTLNYWVKLQGQGQDHPTQETIKPCWQKELKESKSFGWTTT